MREGNRMYMTWKQEGLFRGKKASKERRKRSWKEEG